MENEEWVPYTPRPYSGKSLYGIWTDEYDQMREHTKPTQMYLDHSLLDWKFKIGSKVRHKELGTEYTVAETPWAKTCPSRKTWVTQSDISEGYAVVTKNLELVEEEENMTQLYQFEVDGKTKFGTKLAVNSAGEWVMEEKGSSDVIAVKKDLVEEVIPYSVDIQFQDTISYNYSYTSVEGKFEVNDLLLMESPRGGFSLAVVKAVNTKSKAATKELKPIAKLLTQPVD